MPCRAEASCYYASIRLQIGLAEFDPNTLARRLSCITSMFGSMASNHSQPPGELALAVAPDDAHHGSHPLAASRRITAASTSVQRLACWIGALPLAPLSRLHGTTSWAAHIHTTFVRPDWSPWPEIPPGSMALVTPQAGASNLSILSLWASAVAARDWPCRMSAAGLLGRPLSHILTNASPCGRSAAPRSFCFSSSIMVQDSPVLIHT